ASDVWCASVIHAGRRFGYPPPCVMNGPVETLVDTQMDLPIETLLPLLPLRENLQLGNTE
uniref:hypothetical protein n=1 Tax=Longimicrobium sp. TaxID=2029185 RepID=UPI003B3A9F99